MQVILLCAGGASRMSGCNKCMLDIKGKPLIQHYLDRWPNEEVTVVVGAHVPNKLKNNNIKRELRFVANEEWSTSNSAKSLALAFERDDQDAIIINGDTFFECELPYVGFYCRPLKESMLVEADNENGEDIVESIAVFKGVAVTTQKQNKKYLKTYSDAFKDEYWWKVFRACKEFNSVIANYDAFFEFDTEEDYNLFKRVYESRHSVTP